MSKIITHLQKEFYRNFEYLTNRQERRIAWDDFITIFQSALDINKRLENEPLPTRITDFYHDDEWECFGRMFDLTMEALEWNPAQDFLGTLYMQLRLSNRSRGEEFTPYEVCQMMSSLTIDGVEECIQKRGWASVHDPACGAGATLIAFANECIQRGIDFQRQVLFVGQDISWTVAGMCFVQLSLLGCGGYVVVGNTLSSPLVSPNLLRPIKQEHQQIWYTPTYYLPPWSDRVVIDWFRRVDCEEKEGHNSGTNKETDGHPAENHEEGGKDV